jgi:hypothetical protein
MKGAGMELWSSGGQKTWTPAIPSFIPVTQEAPLTFPDLHLLSCDMAGEIPSAPLGGQTAAAHGRVTCGHYTGRLL